MSRDVLTFPATETTLPNGLKVIVVPTGFRLSDGTPTSLTFTGKLFGENDLLAVADLFQRATDFHTRRPKLTEAAAAKG